VPSYLRYFALKDKRGSVVKYIEITLSSGNINQGHFYLPRETSLFPKESWGGKNKSEMGKRIEVSFDGIAELTSTDIDGTKRLFRKARGESKRFLKHYALKAGDVIYVSKISNHQFIVSTKISGKEAISATVDDGIDGSTSRKDTIVSRIIRDTAMAQKIKQLYDHKCQVCGTQLSTPKGPYGPYAEGAHIKGLGAPHNGPDTEANNLCLCPNHHVMFDKGGFTINSDFTLNRIEGNLTVNHAHIIGSEYLEYHKNNA